MSFEFKRGKLPPLLDTRTLMFAKYLKPQAPPLPRASADYYKAVPHWPMMGNDTLGDCTCAAAGHMIQNWTANTGTAKVIPDHDIVKFYRIFSPMPHDKGANMLTVLKTWRKAGLDKDKINAFVKLNTGDETHAKQAVDLFGSCYIGVALPDSVVPPHTDLATVPWVVPAGGAVGAGAPNPHNGHCIPAVGYDKDHLYVVTWGTLKSMSWDFYHAYADEAYGVLSTDWAKKSGGAAPSGFDFAALQNDLKGL